VGPRTGLDAVSKRKIPSPRRDSNPNHPIVQPVVCLLFGFVTNLTQHVDEIVGDSDVMDDLLIRYSAFVRYWSAIGQYMNYLWTSEKSVTQWKGNV